MNVRTASPLSPTLLLMLKAPRPGYVKTRLAAALGSALAATLYRRLAEHQLAAAPAAWSCEVHFAPASALTEMRNWLGPTPGYFPQTAGDLGPRLVAASAAAAARRPGAPLLIVGGDCPTLDRATLTEAAALLEKYEVVLGPAQDGGYYLIGFRRPQPELFADIPWSTAEVFATTLARIAALGLTHALLPRMADIDEPADLAFLPGKFLASPVLASLRRYVRRGAATAAR